MKRIDLLTLAKEIIEDSKTTIQAKARTGIPLAFIIARVLTAAILTVQLLEAHQKAGDQLWQKSKFSQDEIALAQAIIAKTESQDNVLKALESQLLKSIKEYHEQITQSSAKKKLNKLVSRFLNPHIILEKS